MPQPHPLAWKRWIACLSKRTQHWYYYDRNTKESTWYKPKGWGTTDEPAPILTPPSDEASEIVLASDTNAAVDVAVVVVVANAQTLPASPAKKAVPLVRTASAGAATLRLHHMEGASERSDEASVLSQWLRTEGEQASFLVDSGDFGRPVTKQGVMAAWQEVTSAHSHDVFAAHYNGIQMGHIELMMHNVDEEKVWCHWSGVPRYAMLAYVYVLPYFRGKKLGTVMVTRACQRAFDSGAKKVHILLQETNTPLRRFYERVGFEESAQCYWRGDEKLIMMELAERPSYGC